MHVKLARTAGFCMGVKLAIEKTLASVEQGQPVYTHGPLIHNRQAIELLEAKGVLDIEQCPNAPPGIVLLRAHGVPPAVEEALRARGQQIVDATCPHVVASQRRIERYAAQGYTIVLAGDKDHAEIAALRSRAGPRCLVISSLDEARALELTAPACLIAQTTFSTALYADIAAELRRKLPTLEVVNSICRATEERQAEALRLCREVDAMVVVGGRHSANSCRLAELCRQSGKPTFHVETAAELDPQALAAFRVVGLTAGASTPNWVTRSVLQALEDTTPREPKAQWWLWRGLTALTRSNVYSALAAAALTYACTQLMAIPSPSLLLLLAAFCYIFAVTTLNRLAIGEEPPELRPPRVAFYQHHARPLLAASAVLAIGSVASIALAGERASLLLLLAAYALGVAYSVPLVPPRWRRRLPFARLKDLPASKDLFVAAAWTVVCALVPWVASGGRLGAGFAAAVAFAFVLTFVKANVMDLRDMQEDFLLGRETLPLLLGAGRTRYLMAGLAVGLGLALAAAAASGAAPAVAWLLIASPACLLAHLIWRARVHHASDVTSTLIADGALLLAGLLALAWHALRP